MRPWTSHTRPKVTSSITTIGGARFTMKSMNVSSSTTVPMMMFGGSPDERGRPPDVRGQHLDYEEGDRVLLEYPGDDERHGEHQQHGGDVVQEGREHGGYAGQVDQDEPGPPPGGLGALYGEVAEDARVLEDADQDHHPDQEPQGLPVDGLDGLLLADGPGDHEHHPRRRAPPACGAPCPSRRRTAPRRRPRGPRASSRPPPEPQKAPCPTSAPTRAY